MTFSLSSAYPPQLPNDVFIQHRAEAICFDSCSTCRPSCPPPSHNESPRSRAAWLSVESTRHSRRWLHVVPSRWHQGGMRIQEGVLRSSGSWLIFQTLAVFSRQAACMFSPINARLTMWLKQIKAIFKICLLHRVQLGWWNNFYVLWHSRITVTKINCIFLNSWYRGLWMLPAQRNDKCLRWWICKSPWHIIYTINITLYPINKAN
jgi:hypothetical protein